MTEYVNQKSEATEPPVTVASLSFNPPSSNLGHALFGNAFPPKHVARGHPIPPKAEGSAPKE